MRVNNGVVAHSKDLMAKLAARDDYTMELSYKGEWGFLEKKLKEQR